jgi:hypothetical protein
MREDVPLFSEKCTVFFRQRDFVSYLNGKCRSMSVEVDIFVS